MLFAAFAGGTVIGIVLAVLVSGVMNAMAAPHVFEKQAGDASCT